ncbi:MAG: hypothetical protein HQM16_18005 [Deltaproteobacteria bacterium]|nr:hypothetical protein [Deltaproteobacteria bacterium]
MLGLQIAGVQNWARRLLIGGQLAMRNLVEGVFKGAQLSLISSDVQYEAKGVQISGIAGKVRQGAGVQVAGLYNTSHAFKGVQAASIVNASFTDSGIQATRLSLLNLIAGAFRYLFPKE